MYVYTRIYFLFLQMTHLPSTPAFATSWPSLTFSPFQISKPDIEFLSTSTTSKNNARPTHAEFDKSTSFTVDIVNSLYAARRMLQALSRSLSRNKSISLKTTFLTRSSRDAVLRFDVSESERISWSMMEFTCLELVRRWHWT